MSLERLTALVAPPQHPVDAGTPDQWPEVERALGTTLPQDYKQLVNIYGVGFFANWIYITSPFSTASAGFRLGERRLLEAIVSGRETYPEYSHPFAAYPEPGGLLPWGGDDDAGLFCWITRGAADEWITVNLDNKYSDQYREIPTSATGLLAGWFAGDITGDWYPEDVVPTEERVFTPGYSPDYPL